MDDSSAMAGSQNHSGISVHAGFPNPAADRHDAPLSLDRLLIHSPLSTYLFRVRGHQWEERGIYDGDLALIDRSLTPRKNELVIMWQDEGFAILPFSQLRKQTEPWGTITTIIHQYGSTGIQQ